MPQSAPKKQGAPAELLTGLSGGYDGYTVPTEAPWKRWASAVNIYSGAFNYIQRCRFANVISPAIPTGLPFTTLKYFALPGLSAYLMADVGGLLYSYDTGAAYAVTQRINPHVDVNGVGNSLLNGPWSRESLGNILYEMNGQVKQSGRLANAATVESFGLDSPDASPQVTLNLGGPNPLTGLTRLNGIVTATSTVPFSIPAPIINIANVSDPSFDGSFTISASLGAGTIQWVQLGQDTTVISGFGTWDFGMTKAVGRSYCFAWENANTTHVGAPSPVTQYILYQDQWGTITCKEVGTISVTAGGGTVTGVGTQFTAAWVGRKIMGNISSVIGRVASVSSPTVLTLFSPYAGFSHSGDSFQIYDDQATHLRLYATADGGATYFRIARNSFLPGNFVNLTFKDSGNAEPPSFPFTTETAQFNNIPPPIGAFLNEYQGRLCVFGVPGATQSIFYSNIESTTIGLPPQSFAPLNQITLPIANGNINGMLEFPGSAIIWSDKQDMFRLTGLLSDNTVAGAATAAANAALQQGASIARLPYALGCASPFACEITPLGGVWLSSNAEIWLFTDKYAPKNIGRPVQDILATITKGSINLCRMKYYHTDNRNWLALAIPANFATYNNTVLMLDLDLLASNGSPSYFTFDMATNAPVWFIFQPGTTVGGNWLPRCDSIETVYEANGFVRLLVGQTDLIQDIDAISGGTGTEISVPNGSVTLHAWGNDSAFVIKRPGWIRFNTNRDPSMLATDGWSFAVQGIDDDFYTFFNPLTLPLVPGVNDSSTLGGNPDFLGGLAFRHSPEMYKIGGVNFVMGRRLKFQINFPPGTGVNYQLRSVQLGFDANAAS
jgi:hypothetical protein